MIRYKRHEEMDLMTNVTKIRLLHEASGKFVIGETAVDPKALERKLHAELDAMVNPPVVAKGEPFGWAVNELKAGGKVAREGWNGNGNGMWLEAQIPDANSKMTQPYAYMNVPGCEEGMRRIPYVCTTIDMFSEDWVVVA